MGGVCSRGNTNKRSKVAENRNRGFSGKLKSMRSFNKPSQSSKKSNSEREETSSTTPLYFSSELKPMPIVSSKTKSSKRSSLLGRAGTAAVDVLDTLGSSVSNLNAGSGFISGATTRGNKVTVLAFEVANTIAKGAALLESLSEQNLRLFKKEVLSSKGVKNLVSTDKKELLRIAASDKREELDIFAREVIRFGSLCKDPQWHNLDRYFIKIESEQSQRPQLRDEAEAPMQELVSLAQYTSELYHEMQALDRFEQDYNRKLEEVDSLNLSRKEEGLTILQHELRQQKKLVGSLKKKSLWSKNLEEIMDKLVDVVAYIQEAIAETFHDKGSRGTGGGNRESLGEAGLALHYANVIQQIDSIASRPSSLPSNIRDALYNGLPAGVKTALRSRLRSLHIDKEVPESDIKDEMEKSLHWLVPLATNTTKAHQGFGWVGEWANTGISFGNNRTSDSDNTLTRLQTLYHADKHKTDAYILELVISLHRLIIQSKRQNNGTNPHPLRSPTNPKIPVPKTQLSLSPNYFTNHYRTRKAVLSLEDVFLLERVSRRKLNLGRSMSHGFTGLKMKKKNRGMKLWALSRSVGSTPKVPENSNVNANLLDVMDGLDFKM